MTNTEFLDRINWNSDDGVFFPMLMDWRRNQFYDQIIKQQVVGKHCVDVGFGTGLLSILALKHGAKHVTAYEQNADRYELGKYIIDRLGLQSKIDLVHQQFDHQTSVSPQDVVITETVNIGLWGEGLWQSMPRAGNYNWLPSSVFMEIIAEPVSQAFADDLFRPADHFGFFNPGVDIDPDYVSLINQLAKKNIPNKSHFYDTDNHQTTVWGGWTYVRWSQVGKTPVAHYKVDLGQHSIEVQDSVAHTWSSIDFTAQEITMTVDLPSNDRPMLIVPRTGICHDNNLFLDTAESWGGGCKPLLVTANTRRVTIAHNTESGLITYSQE